MSNEKPRFTFIEAMLLVAIIGILAAVILAASAP